jgi:hypothetical protein
MRDGGAAAIVRVWAPRGRGDRPPRDRARRRPLTDWLGHGRWRCPAGPTDAESLSLTPAFLALSAARPAIDGPRQGSAGRAGQPGKAGASKRRQQTTMAARRPAPASSHSSGPSAGNPPRPQPADTILPPPGPAPRLQLGRTTDKRAWRCVRRCDGRRPIVAQPSAGMETTRCEDGRRREALPPSPSRPPRPALNFLTLFVQPTAAAPRFVAARPSQALLLATRVTPRAAHAHPTIRALGPLCPHLIVGCILVLVGMPWISLVLTDSPRIRRRDSVLDYPVQCEYESIELRIQPAAPGRPAAMVPRPAPARLRVPCVCNDCAVRSCLCRALGLPASVARPCPPPRRLASVGAACSVGEKGAPWLAGRPTIEARHRAATAVARGRQPQQPPPPPHAAHPAAARRRCRCACHCR